MNLKSNPIIELHTDTLTKMIASALFIVRLREAFNIASIANNHILDAGNKVFIDIIDLMRAYGFEIAGGGKNITSTDELRIMHVNGVRIGIIACADFIRTLHGHGNRGGKAQTRRLHL